jgi:hypothetical protein
MPIVIGLVHGQYERDVQAINSKALASAGIAIVVPASKIRKLIMRKKLRNKRARDLNEAKKARAKDAPATAGTPDFTGE